MTLDAVRTAQKRLDYVGAYTVERVARVAESVVSVESDVQVSLSFHIDNQRLAVINGSTQVAITLMC